jgi:hypothetical protein
MLCYVAHHDPACDWASWRKIETHHVTGTAQIVEIRETVREIQIPLHIPADAARESARSLLWHGIMRLATAATSPGRCAPPP